MSKKELAALLKRQREKEREKRMMRKFLEEEAELGSDNEDNDDVRKIIDKNGDEVSFVISIELIRNRMYKSRLVL